jgi:hypothetical protein
MLYMEGALTVAGAVGPEWILYKAGVLAFAGAYDVAGRVDIAGDVAGVYAVPDVDGA